MSLPNGCVAGPWITSPEISKREPWQGQSQVRSAAFHPTRQHAAYASGPHRRNSLAAVLGPERFGECPLLALAVPV